MLSYLVARFTWPLFLFVRSLVVVRSLLRFGLQEIVSFHFIYFQTLTLNRKAEWARVGLFR